jgi:hypothetical protein
MNVGIMKKETSKSALAKQGSRIRRGAKTADDMRSHYDFDYKKSRPNRFAKRMSEEATAVVLDPDVANVFRSAEAVNTFLRSAISAMPKPESSRKKAS